MEYDRHNRSLLAMLAPGDLVEFPRGVYSHWGVYLGDGDIIHLAGDEDDGIDAPFKPQHFFTISGVHFSKAKVCIQKFMDVVEDCFARKNNSYDNKKDPLPREQIIKNALAKRGRVGYNLITQNCEHFAKWCRYGEEKSDQVDTALTGLAVGGAALFTAGLIAAVAKYWGSTSKSEEEEEEEEKEKGRSYKYSYMN